ncbi:MAG: TrbC/VirB2 family protein [Rickettsiales bacterium]
MNKCNILFLFIIFLVSVVLLPDVAMATDTVIGNMMCTVNGWMLGTTGKGLLTIGTIIVGLLAIFNKITWGFAIIHGVGSVLIIEGAYIVNSLNSGGTGCA